MDNQLSEKTGKFRYTSSKIGYSKIFMKIPQSNVQTTKNKAGIIYIRHLVKSQRIMYHMYKIE